MKKLIKSLTAIALLLLIQACSNSSYSPDNYFKTEKEKEDLINYFLPYVLPKPDIKNALDLRFSDSLKSYYQEQKVKDELVLHSYYINPKDSLHFIMFVRRDRRSLYIDYRATAGTFRKSNDSIVDVELKFLTPMLRRDTIDRFAPMLFNELVTKGNVESYVGNRDYIDWPSNDVFYDKENKKWALKADSEWNTIVKTAKGE